ncbi:MAG: cytochrome c family protein, partial [Pseudomonadota bacterium]
RVAAACKSCHDFAPGSTDSKKSGPLLAGVLGRTAGTYPGFTYSEPMKAFGQSWSYDQLNSFLQSPKKLVAGTAMSFAGLPKAEDRIAAIAYLRSISPSAPAIPAPDPARDPAVAAAATTAEAAPANAVAGNAVASTTAATTNAVAPAAAPAH